MLSIDWFTLARIGLLYDVVGAIILVWGYISQGKQEFQAEISFYGPDEPTTAVSTKMDSIFGVGFILVGFLAQLAGSEATLAVAFSSWSGYAICTLILLLISGGGYLILRKFLFACYLRYLKDKLLIRMEA